MGSPMERSPVFVRLQRVIFAFKGQKGIRNPASDPARGFPKVTGIRTIEITKVLRGDRHRGAGEADLDDRGADLGERGFKAGIAPEPENVVRLVRDNLIFHWGST